METATLTMRCANEQRSTNAACHSSLISLDLRAQEFARVVSAEMPYGATDIDQEGNALAVSSALAVEGAPAAAPPKGKGKSRKR